MRRESDWSHIVMPPRGFQGHEWVQCNVLRHNRSS